MFSTEPLTLRGIFANSMKIYKKDFMLIMPVSIFLSFVHIINGALERAEHPWGYWYILPLAFLGVLSFYWGICLVAKVSVEPQDSDKKSLKMVARRFLPALFFPAVLLAAVISSIFFAKELGVTSLADEPGLNIFIAALAVIFAFYFLYVSVIYTIEVLLEDKGIFVSIKRAFKAASSFKSVMRALGFIIMLTLIGILVFLPTTFLAWLVAYISANILGVSITFFSSIIFFSFSVMALVWTPVYLIAFVCFYKDVMIRTED